MAPKTAHTPTQPKHLRPAKPTTKEKVKTSVQGFIVVHTLSQRYSHKTPTAVGPCAYRDTKIGRAVDDSDSGGRFGAVEGLGEEGPHGSVADKNECEAC